MKIQVGNFHQKASWFIVGFVFGCIFVITVLLYIMQRAEAVSQDLSSVLHDSQYIP
ncbi:MAG: hypothetical protein WAX85_00860 [Minisyncoccia bacterium]